MKPEFGAMILTTAPFASKADLIFERDVASTPSATKKAICLVLIIPFTEFAILNAGEVFSSGFTLTG